MNKHIIISEQQKEQVKGNYGLYSAIEPVVCPDRNYIIPEACLSDKDLTEVKSLLQSMLEEDNIQNIIDLPESGTIEAGRIYGYSEGVDNGYSGLVICVQEHERTIYKPEETPALFSFFRENSNELDWIPNEFVELGWKRWHNGIQYEVIQPHQTQTDWTPDTALDVLWKSLVVQEEKPPQWISSDYYKYTVGYQVYDSGKIWEAINTTHTWIQPALEGNGAISWKFVKDWIE